MIVGVDLGTQSCKAVVCDDALVVRGEAAERYPIAFPRAGWAEQDPAAWVDALAPAIGRALAAAGVGADAITALGITGQLDGCVPVDGDGAAVGPCLIWMDRRATDELPALDAARFAEITGQLPDASHLAAKIRWLDRHRPGAARFHQPVSYVIERLTGAAIMDPSHASTTMLWDLAAGAWSHELLTTFAIDVARLPAIAPAASVAGPLTSAGAALTGLRAGITVAVGTGDDFAAPLGAGVVAPGRAVCVVGTAEVVGALSSTPVRDDLPERMVETHAYPGRGWFVENPGWLSGGALTWLGGLLGVADPAELDRLALETPAGADGLLFLPALSGATAPAWRAGARGAFYGLTPAHGRGHLARALLEAMAHAERDVLDRLRGLGVASHDVILVGGGARSHGWAQLRADITGRPHAIASTSDAAALGAAMLAGVADSLWPDLAHAATHVPAPRTMVTPDASTWTLHDDAHGDHHRLFACLEPLY